MTKVKHGKVIPEEIEPEEIVEDKLEEKPPEEVKPELEKPEEIKQAKTPVTYKDYIEAGYVSVQRSESLQREGKKVVEILKIDNQILHKLED